MYINTTRPRRMAISIPPPRNIVRLLSNDCGERGDIIKTLRNYIEITFFLNTDKIFFNTSVNVCISVNVSTK